MTERILESLNHVVDSVISAAPAVITGIMLVALALIAAKVVERVLRAVLVRVRFDALIRRAGIDKTLHRIGLRQELDQFIPRLVYFLLLFLVAKSVSDALGLVAVSEALAAFFGYIPNLIGAVLLVMLGGTAAQFAGRTVRQAAEDSGIVFARSLGTLVTALVYFVVGMMAMAQLHIDTGIVRTITTACLAGVALAFGLSFGLGSREATRNIVAGFYARKILRVGEELQVGAHRGVLKGITPTHTLIATDDRTISISNSSVLEEVVRQ